MLKKPFMRFSKGQSKKLKKQGKEKGELRKLELGRGRKSKQFFFKACLFCLEGQVIAQRLY